MKNYLPLSPTAIDKQALFDYNALVLSLIGDSVHTLFVRTMLLKYSPFHLNDLHHLVTELVCATAQAVAVKTILPLLTEDENFIFRKCKNAHARNIPKHATMMDYKYASAFEGILGFLYLNGQNERINELMDAIYKEKYDN